MKAAVALSLAQLAWTEEAFPFLDLLVRGGDLDDPGDPGERPEGVEVLLLSVVVSFVLGTTGFR